MRKSNMKKYIFILLLCALTLNAEAKKKTLTILHTNDTHSTIMPFKEDVGDTMKAGRAGFLRRITMIEEQRKKSPNLLLFDSGDFSQGSSYYTMFGGEVEVELMNLMGYDAATIGNHEFDLGLENMAKIFRQAKFPIVCTNYDFRGTCVEGLVKQYIVIERDGIKIGVFGVSPRLNGLVSEKNCAGVKFIDPRHAAQVAVKHLKEKEGCDVIICLSHLGWDIKPDIDDNTLIPVCKEIDLVLGGHSHTYLEQLEWVKDAEGKPVPVDQNGKHGIFVGKIEMELTK